jgi:hypothetical protein
VIVRRRLLCVVLLVVTTALFVIGTTSESNAHDETSASGQEHAIESEGEHTEEGESEEPHAEEGEAGESRIFGLDRESNGLIGAAVIVSVALAALDWFRPRREVWVAVIGVTLAFAVLDVDELRHQLDKSAGGLAVLAAAVAIGHLLTAGVAVGGARSSSS